MEIRRIQPEDITAVVGISDPTVHPITGSTVYVAKVCDEQSNGYRTFLRIVSADGSEDVALTDGKSDTAPQWSPDGERLAFIRAGEGGRQVWSLSMADHSVMQMTNAPRGVIAFAWAPDSRRLAYVSKSDGAMTPNEAGGKAYIRTVPKAEGAGWWDGRYAHLFVQVVDSEAIQLTSGAFQVSQPAWTPDGKQIAFLSKWPDDLSQDPDRLACNDLFTVDLKDRKVTRLTASKHNITQYQYAPDGSHIALIADDRSVGSGTSSRLYLLPASGGIPQVYHAQTDVHLGNVILNDVKVGPAAPGPVFGANGDIYAIGSFKGEAQLFRFRAGESPQAVTAGIHDLYQIDARILGGYLIGTAIDQDGPAELVAIRLDDGSMSKLTRHHDTLVRQLNFHKPEELWTQSAEGQPLQSWIIRPPDLPAGQKVPLVLVIHGGPHAMYAPVYSLEMQALAAAGYAVLFGNPRGSFGYGQAFAQGCRGDFGNGDYRDLMAMVDNAIAQCDFVDGDRLGVMGGSYGGLMTNWIVGQESRFGAAVSLRGISNWLSFHGLSDIGLTYTEAMAGATPWEDAQLLWRRSPLAHAPAVTAPVLIMHGEEDLRCPVGQADEWYTALKRHGVISKLIRYPKSNHGFQKNGKISYRLEVIRETTAWFKQYLG